MFCVKFQNDLWTEMDVMRKWDFVTFHLTHWGRVTHICVNKLTIIGSDNGLSPDRRQAIIWTNAGILLIGPLGTNFSEILIEILTFSFKKMRLKVLSAKRRPFCLGLNVLTHCGRGMHISMGLYKNYVTPLLMHWSYIFLALTHRYEFVDYIIIGWGRGLSPIQHQTIIWTNADLLSIRPLRNNLHWNINWTFSFLKSTWKCCLQNGVLASMCLGTFPFIYWYCSTTSYLLNTGNPPYQESGNFYINTSPTLFLIVIQVSTNDIHDIMHNI